MNIPPLKSALLLLAAALTVPAATAAERKPNVVLFLVDDMGWMDCGIQGSKYYQTPNIDRFATRAMRFTACYAQPLCSPTRASLLTGQYPARHGVTTASGHQPPQPPGHKFLPDAAPANRPVIAPESKNYLEPSAYTLAEALRDAGYRTGHFGKWHLGLTQPHWPEQQGFDVAFHCHPDPGPPGNYFSPYGVVADGKPNGKTRVGTITDGPPGEYIVDRLAEESVKFITANKDRPFFLNLWNYGVHGPWGHKEEYTKIFAAKKDPRGVQGNPIMASMLRSVDECFGRVLETLDRLGIADHTIIIFNSDNGGNTHSNTSTDPKSARKAAGQLGEWSKWAGDRPPTNNAPLRDGKGTLYEGGTRVPLMWAWAGHIQPATTSNAIVGHIDLYPTVLDLLGLPRPKQQQIDGVSYAAVLRGTGGFERDAFFNFFPHGKNSGGVSVRVGDLKLIRWFDPALPRELYDLRADLGEETNLAAAQPEKVKQLDARIDAFLASTGALVPRPNPAFQPARAKPLNAKAGAAAADPLEGWKARQCDATVKDGVLSITSTARPGAMFLGHAMGRMSGPVVVKFRVRAADGGAGKVEWMGDQSAPDSAPKSVAFQIAGGDWQEQSVEVPAQGLLGTTRLYLPASAKPLELDWVEIGAKSAKARPQRWDFSEPAK